LVELAGRFDLGEPNGEDRVMGRLHVAAASSPGAAEDGNREFLHVIASVIDHDGDAVEELSASDFAAEAMIVGPGGRPVEIAAVSERSPGVYLAELEPRRPWTDGTYLVALTVEPHHDRGQTIVAAPIPE
jgi:hypothetical protein